MTPPRRYFDEIEVGEEYESPGRTVTEADIVLFAGVSGDYNILHTDAEFMKSSIFGERIAHGLLGLSIQSGLLSRGMQAYAALGQTGIRWKFKNPIKIGDTIRVKAKEGETFYRTFIGQGLFGPVAKYKIANIPVVHMNTSGDMTVIAGRDLKSGAYYEGSGHAGITVGGGISASWSQREDRGAACADA